MPPEAAEAMAPSPNALAGTFGAASGPRGAPNMIGDFFGVGSSQMAIPGVSAPVPVTVFLSPRNSATPVILSPSLPINFPTDSTLFSGATIPAGQITSLSDYQTISNAWTDVPGATVAVDAGTPAMQAAIAQGLQNLRGPGATVFGPGQATLISDSTGEQPDTALSSEDMFDVAISAVFIPDVGIVLIDVPSPAASVVGRLKIAENTSPMPQDRILFDTSYFNDVAFTANGVDVVRFVPGFEKTFLDGMASFELRAPMALTLNSTIVADGGTDASHGEFGNLTAAFKFLLMQQKHWAASVGMSVGMPTADDLTIIQSDGTPLVQIKNEAVHVGPFLGFLWTPNDRIFAQSFVQYDVDTGGNEVFINRGAGLDTAGRINDSTFQFVDVAFGYWLHRDPSPCAYVQGIAGIMELHWNSSLNGTDVVVDDGYVIGNFAEQVDMVNLTVGAHYELANDATVTMAYVTPIGNGADQQFDGEFRLTLNQFFGRSTRVPRVPTF